MISEKPTVLLMRPGIGQTPDTVPRAGVGELK